MKKMLVSILAILTFVGFTNFVFAENDQNFEEIKFIQYLDENTALEETRKGNLDIYYYKISPDRLEDYESRENLKTYESTGGSYSLLVNPAESKEFNPFSNKDVRFALNYLVDRKLIVNELMGGFGNPIISYYGPSDPEFLNLIDTIEKFSFEYDPVYANKIISKAMESMGAEKNGNNWTYQNLPINIKIFIRSDDPVRKSIGELLAKELTDSGFQVQKDYGDLNKAFVLVYGSNPAELKWNIYTEGWGRSAFVRYDSVGLSQMYSPWFSNMPGFNIPTNWNYQNDSIDEITKRIYSGDFKNSDERTELIKSAINQGISESVRIFLASKTDLYVTNENISGVVNDFGAGIPTRFTPINAKGDGEKLVIGVKQIYQGSWNPVAGFSDTYSRQIWDIILDPALISHPFNGKILPYRVDWVVEKSEINGIQIPTDSILWDSNLKEWRQVGEQQFTKSKVTLDFKFSNWHNQSMMDIYDILYSMYFASEWSEKSDDNDRTFDSEFSPRVFQSIQTIKGIRIIDNDTMEVYLDYSHFDEGEIAQWGMMWSSVPWEITAAMEETVLNDKSSFSRSSANSKNTSWLSLIVPKDAIEINTALKEFQSSKHIPESLKKLNLDQSYFQNRYDKSIQWIEKYNHAVISNGPFYLQSYSPESRTIELQKFPDTTYQMPLQILKEFENPAIPEIIKVDLQKNYDSERNNLIEIDTQNIDEILFFVSDEKGNIIYTDRIFSDNSGFKIDLNGIDYDSSKIYDVKIFGISNTVLKPDYYETSFIIGSEDLSLKSLETNQIIEQENKMLDIVILIVIALVIIGLVVYFKKIRLVHNH